MMKKLHYKTKEEQVGENDYLYQIEFSLANCCNKTIVEDVFAFIESQLYRLNDQFNEEVLQLKMKNRCFQPGEIIEVLRCLLEQ